MNKKLIKEAKKENIVYIISKEDEKGENYARICCCFNNIKHSEVSVFVHVYN